MVVVCLVVVCCGALPDRVGVVLGELAGAVVESVREVVVVAPWDSCCEVLPPDAESPDGREPEPPVVVSPLDPLVPVEPAGAVVVEVEVEPEPPPEPEPAAPPPPFELGPGDEPLAGPCPESGEGVCLSL